MKFCATIVLIVLVGLVADSNALPARKRMAYYRQNAYYSGPQRMMYVQYMQPGGRTHARSTQAAAALVAGETVATGSYLDAADVATPGTSKTVHFSKTNGNGNGYTNGNGAATINVATGEQGTGSSIDVVEAAGAHAAHSVAEAYPDLPEVSQQVEVDLSKVNALAPADEAAVYEGAAIGGGVKIEGQSVVPEVFTQEEFVAPEIPSESHVAEPETGFGVAEDSFVGSNGGSLSSDARVVPVAAPAESNVETRFDSGFETAVIPEKPAVPTVTVTVQQDAVKTNGAKAPRDYHFAAAADPEPAVPAVEITAQLPATKPIAPLATPARRYLPSKKKVIVELEQSSENDAVAEEDETAVGVVQEDAEEEEEDDTQVAAVAPKFPARRPAAKRPVAAKPGKSAADCAGCAKAKPSRPALPAGTFFPIDFGGTAGGAIAIANSFSTGEGGSATSHAIAYGSPDAVRARARPSKFH